jgi:hypothetical protein
MNQPGKSPKQFLVRHLSTDRFLNPDGRWVEKAEAALSFPNLLNAINACLARRREDVELILRFGDNVPDSHVPVAVLR